MKEAVQKDLKAQVGVLQKARDALQKAVDGAVVPWIMHVCVHVCS